MSHLYNATALIEAHSAIYDPNGPLAIVAFLAFGAVASILWTRYFRTRPRAKWMRTLLVGTTFMSLGFICRFVEMVSTLGLGSSRHLSVFVFWAKEGVCADEVASSSFSCRHVLSWHRTTSLYRVWLLTLMQRIVCLSNKRP